MTFLIGRYSFWGAVWARRDRRPALLTANNPRPPRNEMYLNILEETDNVYSLVSESNMQISHEYPFRVYIIRDPMIDVSE